MRKRTVLLAALATVAALGLPGCASCSRLGKSIESDMGGGLNRTVTLYTTTGEPIKEWRGKIDLTDSEEEVMFDLDGERVVIHGGIVVAEEGL